MTGQPLADDSGLPPSAKAQNPGPTGGCQASQALLSDTHSCPNHLPSEGASSHPSLTEEVSEPLRLVVMDDGHTGSVERHQAQDNPVKHLGFHHVANRDAQKPFLVPEIGGPVDFRALDTGSSERRTYAGEMRRKNEAAKHPGITLHSQEAAKGQGGQLESQGKVTATLQAWAIPMLQAK